MFASRNCGGEYLIADIRERIAKASGMVQTYHGQAREGGKERRDPEAEQPGANQKMAGQKWLSNIGKNSRSWKPFPGPDVELGNRICQPGTLYNSY